MTKEQSNFENSAERKKKAAIDWIEAKWPKERRNCEVCDNSNWDVVEHVTTPLVFNDFVQIGGISYPSVMVICKNCGNTKHFNAVMAGAVEIIVADKQDETKK